MATATYRIFDPLLPRAQAERMLRLCERFGAYGMYSQEASEAEIGQGLFQRHDAVMNFLKTEDLVLERILDLLVEDLRARGRLEGERPDPTSLALMLIDEYVKFPPAIAA